MSTAALWYLTGQTAPQTPSVGVQPGNTRNADPISRVRSGNIYHYDRLNGGQGQYGPSQTQELYLETEFYFAPRRAKGPDVVVVGGQHPSQYPGSSWPAGFNYGDFKPLTSSGIRTFYGDLNIGKFPIDTTPLYYDPESLTLVTGN